MQDRLQQFLQLEQLTPARLSDIIGVQRSGLSHILSGRNKPGFDFIQRLLTKFPTLSADWLITGKGKMYKEVNNGSSFREPKINSEDKPWQSCLIGFIIYIFAQIFAFDVSSY